MPDRRPGLKSKNERLQRWKDAVRLARAEREKSTPNWLGVLNYFRSNPPTNWPADSLKLQVNYVFAWFEALWPRLTYNNPHFTVEPLSDIVESTAPVVEAAVNGELRDIGLGKHLNRAIFDAMLLGVGFLQLGYYSGGLVPTSGSKDEPAEDAGNVAKLAEIGKRDPRYQTSLRGTETVNSDLPYGIEPGKLWIRWHSPKNFLIDPMANSLDDALWCGVEYTRPLAAVKKDPQYKHTDQLEADEAVMPPSMDLEEYKQKFDTDPERSLVRLIQIWDIVERKVLTFAMAHGKFLGESDWTLPVRRFPIYDFHLVQDNYTFWNDGPTTAWINLIEEFNLTISNRMDHIARNRSKMLYNKNTIDDQDIRKLMEARNLAAVGLDINPDVDIRTQFAPALTANLPPDSWAHTAELRQRMTEISGLSEFDLGGTRPGERPATEVSRIGAAGDIRTFGLASRIVLPLSSLGEDTRACMEKYYSEEMVSRIVGEFGQLEWVKYDGTALSGRYLFTFQVEDLAPETREQKQQRAGIALQILTPFTQVASPQPRLDIDPILRMVGRNLGLTPYMRFFPQTGPPVDPGQEFFHIVEKGMEVQPNPMDDDDWHIFTHMQQLELPEVLKNPVAKMKLENHMEAHEAQRLSKQQAAQGAQQAQQGPAPSRSPGLGNPQQQPGPAQGTPSNNQGGGAGPFSGAVSGGADGSNLAELLRGGA